MLGLALGLPKFGSDASLVFEFLNPLFDFRLEGWQYRIRLKRIPYAKSLVKSYRASPFVRVYQRPFCLSTCCTMPFTTFHIYILLIHVLLFTEPDLFAVEIQNKHQWQHQSPSFSIGLACPGSSATRSTKRFCQRPQRRLYRRPQ